MAIRYRIQIDSPRHRVRDEYFIEFKRSEAGAESVITDASRATWMGLEFARIAMRRLREPKYQIRCRLLDEYGNEHDGYDNAPDHGAPLSIHNSHDEFSFRHRGVEIPNMVHNKILKKFYIKFSTSTNPQDPPDRSIAADSPTDAVDLFLDNGHTPAFVIDRYRVDETLPQPVTQAPVIPANTPMITVPAGTTEVTISHRPANPR